DARRRPAASRRGGADQHRRHAIGRLHRVNAGVGGGGGRGGFGGVQPRRGGWPLRLLATPDGEAGDGARTHPVRARPVEDAATVEAVTGAYAAKYGDSPYVQPLLTEESADATLRLEPRP